MCYSGRANVPREGTWTRLLTSKFKSASLCSLDVSSDHHEIQERLEIEYGQTHIIHGCELRDAVAPGDVLRSTWVSVFYAFMY